jgi:putative GTP pyrophosphokinase
VPAHSKKQVRNAGRALRDYRMGNHSVDAVAAAHDGIDVVDWWRAQHATPLARTNAGLRHFVRKLGVDPPEVTQRLKRFTTIVDKLCRHPTMQLDTMEDIAGVRAVLPSQLHVDGLLQELQSQRRWVIRRTREYVTGRDPGPKADGYRAVHLTVVRDGCYVEIQLRTPWQDAWAQSVEQDTRRLSQGLKFGSGPADLREYYRVVADLFEAREMEREPGADLLSELAHLFVSTRRYYDEGESQ